MGNIIHFTEAQDESEPPETDSVILVWTDRAGRHHIRAKGIYHGNHHLIASTLAAATAALLNTMNPCNF